MKVIHNVIVEVDNQYNNDVELSSGHKIIVNTSIENVEFINRKVRVVKAPEFTVLKEGDEIIIHHNILRLRNGIKGETVQSTYWIKDKLYYVPLTEVFMYRRDEGDWNTLNPYCFVKPIKPIKDEKSTLVHSINDISDKDYHKGYIKNIGILSFLNDDLLEMGLKKGDKIAFSKNSEYEFKIDGELYYKMSTRDIIGLFDERS